MGNAGPIPAFGCRKGRSNRVRLAPKNPGYVSQITARCLLSAKPEPLAKFFAAGLYWYIRPEFVAAFQRLSGARSVGLRELAATISDKNLVPMLHSAINALAGAGLLFKEAD